SPRRRRPATSRYQRPARDRPRRHRRAVQTIPPQPVPAPLTSPTHFYRPRIVSDQGSPECPGRQPGRQTVRMVEQVDVVVVGLGPGGEDVAGRLAQAGLSVVGVEQRLVGGECPYYGCVPSKMMIRAGNALAEARRVDALAGHAVVTPDWGPVVARVRDEA